MNRAQQEAYKRDYERAKAAGKPFFPYAVYKDLIVATLAIGLVLVLALAAPIEVGEPVNPTATDFVPRPEWYFFFLFELLILFKGQTALHPIIMATFIIPNVLMALLFLTPFIDRGPERRIWRRPIALFTSVAIVFFLGWLTNRASEAPSGAAAAGELQLEGLTPEAEAGLELFLSQGCTSCHMVKGVGAPGPGPDLTEEGSKGRGIDWQIAHLKEPSSRTPGSSMPAFPGFTDQQYQELATLLEGLGTDFK